MADSLDDVADLAALAEPLRRRLYRYVARMPGPVGREEAALAVGVPVHTAKFHLDRLVDDRLLEVEFRRLTGRTGPGAGRPAKLYRRAHRPPAGAAGGGGGGGPGRHGPGRGGRRAGAAAGWGEGGARGEEALAEVARA